MPDSGARVLTTQAPLSEMGIILHNPICWSAWMASLGEIMVETGLVAMAYWMGPLADMSIRNTATEKMAFGSVVLRCFW